MALPILTPFLLLILSPNRRRLLLSWPSLARPMLTTTWSFLLEASSGSIHWSWIQSGMDHCLYFAMWVQMVLRWWQSVWGETLLGSGLFGSWWCPTTGSTVLRMSSVGRLGGVGFSEGTPGLICLSVLSEGLSLLIVFQFLDHSFPFPSILKILTILWTLFLTNLRTLLNIL